MFLGEWFSAEDALRLGLVNRVVEPENLMETALDLADKVLLCCGVKPVNFSSFHVRPLALVGGECVSRSQRPATWRPSLSRSES